MESVESNELGVDDVSVGSVLLFRMERMTENNFWIRLYRRDGKDIVINVGSEGLVKATYEEDYP